MCNLDPVYWIRSTQAHIWTLKLIALPYSLVWMGKKDRRKRKEGWNGEKRRGKREEKRKKLEEKNLP